MKKLSKEERVARNRIYRQFRARIHRHEMYRHHRKERECTRISVFENQPSR